MGKYKTTENKSINQGNLKSETRINKLFRKISSCLMEIYVLFYLCIFPLSMRDKYFDILSFRFELFWKPTLAYTVIFFFLGLLYLMCDALYNSGGIRKRFFEKTKENHSLLKTLNLRGTDYAIILILIIFSLSTALAEYPYEAFWGDRGRYQGLLIWLMFFAAYWLITRFYKFKKWHIWAYMLFASAVCLWGICNFFLKTFGMFENADNIHMYTFVSSIGNINTYTNFTGIFCGVAVGMFIRNKGFMAELISLLFVIIAGFAQIMGISDNTVLSAGIVFALAPLVLCEDYRQVAKHFTALSLYLGAMKITSVITKKGFKTMNDLDPSPQITMAGKPFFSYILAAVVVLTLFFVIMAIREKFSKSNRILVFKRIWTAFLCMAILSVIVILILANKGWNEELWAPYRNFLIFNDSWGTGRGLIWRLGMEYWRNDATLLMKLFGYGPDTFYIITMDRFMNIMQDAGYGMFDSAHNEYFEYFLTVGIFGLLAYISFLAMSIGGMFKSKDMYAKVIGMGVLAYAVQAVVNIAIPITTPVFMVLLFVGISIFKAAYKIS